MDLLFPISLFWFTYSPFLRGSCSDVSAHTHIKRCCRDQRSLARPLLTPCPQGERTFCQNTRPVSTTLFTLCLQNFFRSVFFFPCPAVPSKFKDAGRKKFSSSVRNNKEGGNVEGNLLIFCHPFPYPEYTFTSVVRRVARRKEGEVRVDVHAFIATCLRP